MPVHLLPEYLSASSYWLKDDQNYEIRENKFERTRGHRWNLGVNIPNYASMGSTVEVCSVYN